MKDRWVFCLQPDAEREAVLRLNDAALVKRYPWAEFRERTGGDYQQWKRSTIGNGQAVGLGTDAQRIGSAGIARGHSESLIVAEPLDAD